MSSTSHEHRSGSRGTLRDEQRDLTRRRLMSAAKTVFERSGYGQATVGDITSEASVNRATFYLHFDNKSEVFEAVIEQVLADTGRYWRLLDDALVKESRSAVREWLEDAVDWWDNNAAILPAWQEALASDPRIAAGWKSMFDRLAVELETYLRRAEPDEREDARTRVQFLVVQLDQVCFRWRVQRVFEMDRRRLLGLLADMWCSVLKIDAP